MTDVINILIRCEFAYHFEFDLRLLNCITRCCKSHIVSKFGHLQLAFVVGSKTTDVFNVLFS